MRREPRRSIVGRGASDNPKNRFERIEVKPHFEGLDPKEPRPETVYLKDHSRSITDPYQPVEKRLRITRRCLEVLAEFRNPRSPNYLTHDAHIGLHTLEDRRSRDGGKRLLTR